MLVPLALCLGMAVVPVVALTHASPPPATPAASRPIRRVSAVADIALARHVADRLSPSDTSDTLPPTTTTTVPPRPVTSVRASYRPTLYRAAPQTTRPTLARRATTTTPHPVARPATTATSPKPASSPPSSTAPSGNSQTGGASWYDAAPPGTCAHQTLPKGTVVHITDLANGATATCTVEDRGPYAGGLIIDLAKDVFSRMAPLSTGVIQVRITW